MDSVIAQGNCSHPANQYCNEQISPVSSKISMVSIYEWKHPDDAGTSCTGFLLCGVALFLHVLCMKPNKPSSFPYQLSSSASSDLIVHA